MTSKAACASPHASHSSTTFPKRAPGASLRRPEGGHGVPGPSGARSGEADGEATPEHDACLEAALGVSTTEGSKLIGWSAADTRVVSRAAATPQEAHKRRRGWAFPFQNAEGASRGPHAHTRRSGTRKERPVTRALARERGNERWQRRTRRPSPTRRREWPRRAFPVRRTSRESEERGPATASRVTSARALARPVRGAFFHFGEAARSTSASTGRDKAVDCRTAWGGGFSGDSIVRRVGEGLGFFLEGGASGRHLIFSGIVC